MLNDTADPVLSRSPGLQCCVLLNYEMIYELARLRDKCFGAVSLIELHGIVGVLAEDCGVTVKMKCIHFTVSIF